MLCVVAVFAFGAILSAQGYGISIGRLYFADNGTYLIDSDDMAMRVSDCSDDAELFKGYQNGDKVILFHDGVNETYPAQTGGYYIIRTSKGDGTYKPADEILGIQELGSDGYLLAAQKVDFDVQYIRTGAQNYEGPFPAVAVIHSTDELTAYYEANKEQFYLERREDPGSDSTIGFLDACDKYDAAFFEDNALVFVVLEEGSGSTRHNIESVKVDANGIMFINVLSIDPEAGTCDMAYWHIMTEVPKDSVPADADGVVIYYNDTKYYDGGSNKVSNETEEMSFSLTWNTYGISSYDSATGKLVKTTDATNPEDYVTTLHLDGTQLFEIWELLWELDIETYPDEYDPQGGELSSDPSMTLILTLRDGDKVKTVRAENIALSYESDDPKGQKFLDTCKGIRDILTATDEWKALPEYEFFYD